MWSSIPKKQVAEVTCFLGHRLVQRDIRSSEGADEDYFVRIGAAYFVKRLENLVAYAPRDDFALPGTRTYIMRPQQHLEVRQCAVRVP